jgi:hypothetical protein
MRHFYSLPSTNKNDRVFAYDIPTSQSSKTYLTLLPATNLALP